MNYRRYLITYGLAVLLLSLLVSSINLIVDPDGRLRWVDISGFNHLKITSQPSLRQGKALALQQCEYDILILGSSRAESGIDPESPIWTGKSAYNAALVSTNMYEMRRMAQFAIAHQHLDAVVIGLDFAMFSEHLSAAADFNQSLLAESLDYWSLARYALSLDTLGTAVRTVISNRQGTAEVCSYNGFYDKPGKVLNAREAFDTIQSKFVANNPESYYYNFQLSPGHLENLELILRSYAEAGVRIYPFISPMHATHMILIDELGLLPVFDAWETELARIVDKVNADLNPSEPIRLWDFAGFNSITTEPVPAAGVRTPMQWYRDSSHYESTVGEMILARMFDPAGPDTAPEDFGVIVTTANVKEVLAEKRRLAAQYEKSQSAEVANSRRIVRDNQQPAPSTHSTPWF